MEIFETGRKYALIPTNKNQLNCVAAVREVLKAGGESFLDDVNTPVGVGLKIRNQPYREIDQETMQTGLFFRDLVVGATVVTGATAVGGLVLWIWRQIKDTFYSSDKEETDSDSDSDSYDVILT